MLELTVKTLDSQNHSFVIADEATVLSLKESIFEKMEVPVASQRLIFHGKVLQDNKKLTDYGDVNGKVIHLVQRAPPSSTRTSDNGGSRSDNANPSGGSGRRLHRAQTNTTYLGSMAIPTDLIDAQAMDLPTRPSQAMARNRIECAKRMMNYARNSIRYMEDPDSQPPTTRHRARRGQASTNTAPTTTADRGVSANSLSQDDAAENSNQTTNATAPQTITAGITVPIAAVGAVSGNMPRITAIFGGANIDLTPTSEPTVTENPEVAVEVEIESDNVESRPDGEASVTDNSATGSRPTTSREEGARVEHMAPLLQDLETIHNQLQPFLARAREILASDPSFDGNNPSPSLDECARVFTGVSETLHNLAHASHALSDLMVDFEEDAPRSLRCRPVVFQHSAILETGFPLRTLDFEGQFDALRAARNANAGAAPSTPPAQAAGDATAPSTPAGGNADATTPPTVPSTPADSNEAQPTPPPNPSTRTRRLNRVDDMGGNVEIFMDFGPEGVTLGSLETTLLHANLNENRSNATGGNQGHEVPAGITIGAFAPPPEMRAYVALPAMLQSVQAFAGQIQNQFMARFGANQGAAQGGPPPASNGQGTPNAAPAGANDNRGPQAARPPGPVPSLAEILRFAEDIPQPEARPANELPPIFMRPPTAETTGSDTSATPQGGNATANNPPTPRRILAPPPVSDIFHSVIHGHFDALLPCNSHHIRNTRQRISQSRGVRANLDSDGQGAGVTPQSPLFTRRPGGATRRRVVNLTMAPPPPPDSTNRSGAEQDNAGLPQFFSNLLSNSSLFPGSAVLTGRSTIAELFEGLSAAPHIDGQSIVSDLFMTLARNLTWQDVLEVSMSRRLESIIGQVQPALQQFASQRLLQGEAPSEEAMNRACERLFTELRPYIDVMQMARLRDSVDLSASINNYNQSQLPEMISLIMDSGTNSNFSVTLSRKITNYVRELVAIIMHCCDDGDQGFDALVRNCVRLLTRGVPEDLQQWTEFHSVNNLHYYAAGLNVPIEDIQRYLVYRIPSAQPEATQPAEQAMETDTAQAGEVWITPAPIQLPEKVEEPISETLVAMDTENLPDLLIGSESWHTVLPPDWVPVIARDSQRQRRQSAQKPLSDAYLSGMPPKRRKIISAAKPQGETVSQNITDGVRHAIQAAGVSSPLAERAVADSGRDSGLVQAYRDQEKATGSSSLRVDPEFKSSRFPNAHKYFDK